MPKRGAEKDGAAAATTTAKRVKKEAKGAGEDIIKLNSDDDGDALREKGVPVAVARKAAKKQAAKLDVKGAFGRNKDDRPRVLYIGHVPHGFYEDQMRAYFGQFGEVTRLRLSRNKKTGRSKHYAYVEFKHPEVAEIVAESMDNYLLFESVIKVRLMTSDECHPELWKGANRKFKTVPWQKKAADVHDRERTEKESAAQAAALLRGERRRRRLIQEAGIEYDFPGYAAAAAGHEDGPESPEPPAKAPKSAAKAPKSTAKASKSAAEPAKTPAKTPGKRAAAGEPPAKPPPVKKAKTPGKTPAKSKTPK